MKLAVVPHNDDESLWLAFTLLREKPLVVVVFDSFVQPSRGIPGTEWQYRREETRRACEILGVEVEYLGLSDADTHITAGDVSFALQTHPRIPEWDGVFAPAFERDGHAQHNIVAEACKGMRVVESYMTYTRTHGKSTGRKVYPEPEWIGLKLKALACYESQFQAATGCAPWFSDNPLTEYYL